MTITGGDVHLIFPEVNITGPVRIQFRMKSGEGTFGQAEVYWRSDQHQPWLESRMVTYPLKHDGQWHTYDIPLPLLGSLGQIRFDPGWKKGQVEFDYVRIVQNTLPESVVKKMQQLPETVTLSDDVLELVYESQKQEFVVTDKRTHRTWKSVSDEPKAALTGLIQKNNCQMLLEYYDLSTEVEYACIVTLEDGGVLSFEINADRYDQLFYGLNTFPPRIQTNFKDGKLIFCNRSSGMYIDQTDSYKDWKEMIVYGNLSLDMPWIGVLDEKTGEGLMVLAETPADSKIVLKKDAQDRNWPQVVWRQSLDTFRYPRRMSYRFSPDGGYVSLAKMYREIAKSTGKLVTLEQKAQRKPNVKLLKGAPMIWGGVDAWDFVREARARGITRGVISNAHHGLRDISTIGKINELGYITNEYENISDILEGSTGFFSDPIQEAAYHMRPGLGPATGWHTEDGPQYYSRSSSRALRAMKTYVPDRLQKYGYNGRFVDVSAALDLFEDYHPEHTFDRRQDMAYRREAFAYLNTFDLVVGTEQGNDWVNDLIEYSEGSAGGPLWWNGGWNAGELKKPTNRDQFNPAYLKYGMGYDVSIPLWQLVYHDCMVGTWYWGDCAGFMYDAAPELSDRKDLFNILYGTVPLFWRDDWGYDWKKNRSRFLQTYHDTCKMNEVVAFDQLLNHEFLNEDKCLQKTEFSSGTVCIVNFGDTPEFCQVSEDTEITLAPRGFYVKGPGIFQSKEWLNGEAVTKIEADGYFRAQTDSKQAVGPVELSGTVTAFEYEKGRWHILLENTNECVIDLQKLIGSSIKSSFLIYTLDSQGHLIRRCDYVKENRKIILRSQHTEGLYTVLLNVPETEVKITPTTDNVTGTTPIELSVLADDCDIRYTLDGSIPKTNSMKYTAPFTIQEASVIRAQAFSTQGQALGEVTEKTYGVKNLLYESPVLKGSANVHQLDIDLSGYEGLILSIDQNGTVVFHDYVDWVDARVIRPDGEPVYLSSLQPSRIQHDHYRFGINERARNLDKADSKPLKLNGRIYEKGLGMVSPGCVEYLFEDSYTRFQTTVGIDESMDDKGEVIVRVYGIR